MLPVIVITYPRTQKMIETKGIKFNPLIQIMKPVWFNDDVKLQLNSKEVLSNSGTISEEVPIFGFRALNVRQAEERLEAMEDTLFMMARFEKERTLQGLEVFKTQDNDTLRLIGHYSVPNVSEKY